MAERVPKTLFALPTRGMVTFPGLMLPVLLESEFAQEVVTKAQAQSGHVGLFASGGPEEGRVPPGEFRKMGVVARVLKVLTLPDGNRSAMMQALHRVQIVRFVRLKPLPIVRVKPVIESGPTGPRAEAQLRNLRGLAREVVEKSGAFPEEFRSAALTAVANIENPGNLCDFCAAYLLKESEIRQRVLEALDINRRLELVVEALHKELQILDLGHSIRDEIRLKTEKAQKEYFLREQIKIIRRELGDEKDARQAEQERLAEQIGRAHV